MNSREKFNSVMAFDTDARVPKTEFAYWAGAIRNWFEQGMPKKADISENIQDSEPVRGTEPFDEKNSELSDKDFDGNFVYLTEEAAEYLISKNIKALGIDYLSVSKFNSNDKVHEILLEKMPIIEGLKLKDVVPEDYIFSGFPLKIKLDGSPIRAVLIRK